jgi:hypothetical protein
MKIYVHREGKHEAEAVDIAADVVIAKALELEDDDEIVVLVEDGDEVVDITLTFEQAGIADRAHVFHGRRHRIDVVVKYNNEPMERTFAASATVARVYKWASGDNGFGLSPAQAAEHTLQLASDKSIPAGDVHVGSLDRDKDGRVTFRIIAKHRYEG